MDKPLNEWDLSQWLFLLENRHPQEIQLGLSRVASVAKKLHLLTPECKVITVAGTNGKGSTVSALEAIYLCAGYQVGLYTSPHLLSFNERIRVNGKPISDVELCHAFQKIETGRGDTSLTYFEMTTLAGLMHFQEHPLDIIILEVGLGGRLDATNIIDADLSIITTIDLDHQEFLGETLEAIGSEKAGILRAGKPCIYADNNPPDSVQQRARVLNSPSRVLGKDYHIQQNEHDWEFHSPYDTITHIPVPRIQLKSAAAALMASLMLNHDLPVTRQHFDEAMRSLFIPGRLQFIHQPDVSFLFDVSHNPQSVQLLAETIKNLHWGGRVFAVFSALKDKDISGLINPLKDCIDQWFPAQLYNKRASSAGYLLSKFKDAEIDVNICYTNPLVAFESALSQTKAGDLIVTYGSFHTVGQIMSARKFE